MRSLFQLVEAWRTRGATLPTAVVASIADDLLQVAPQKPAKRELALEDVQIDRTGRATVEGAGPIGQIALLVTRLLSGGRTGDPPPQLVPFLFRLQDRAAMDREQLRAWIREALGPPAPHEEVAACFDDPAEVAVAEVLQMAAMETHRDTCDEAAATIIDPPRPVEVEIPIISAIELSPPPPRAQPKPAKPSDPPALDTLDTLPPHVAPPPDHRPVVRHEWRPGNATVSVAPAARRSAKPGLIGKDILNVPGERNPWLLWICAAILAFVVALLWLRYN